MTSVIRKRLEEVGTLLSIGGVFASLLLGMYRLVSLFVQLLANEYTAHFWDSHF
ncbi:MAG: hypothetical protein ACYDD2_06745 [Candidatus Acidiferrales bacterium]